MIFLNFFRRRRAGKLSDGSKLSPFGRETYQYVHVDGASYTFAVYPNSSTASTGVTAYVSTMQSDDPLRSTPRELCDEVAQKVKTYFVEQGVKCDVT